MKTSLLLGLLVMVSATYPPAIAQPASPELRVSLSYNADRSQYEVYAEANFANDQFLLGPSQISVVVPKSVADQSLNVISSTGRWTDYSTVFAPATTPESDFHGVYTLGRSMAVQPGVPLLLFAFVLPTGYLDGVRLFVNGQDPHAGRPGMMGGDFVNTLQNHKGTELYRSGPTPTELVQLTQAKPEVGKPTLSVYPNPVTGDVLTVTVGQLAPDERVRLRLLSATGVEFGRVDELAGQLVNYRLRLPRQLTGPAYILAEPLGSTQREAAHPSASGQAFSTRLIILN
ncbi:hypothetical protein [uncultured Fibrella sp.]|uniref:hypothetical protein n=1 Tax=uncultured Fibrella sp. TaxID=1284596 RepID=UPI0035CB11FA